MHVIVVGAGIIGISTAWHLLERGHRVTVVERQPGPALETSFANAAQISVSYCEPWAHRGAPLKALKWMFDSQAPLLFRPQLDWRQWRWGLQFLAQCNDRAFARNVEQIVSLGSYSHAALKDVVSATGIEYSRIERGIAHFYTVRAAFDGAAQAAALMRHYGVERAVVGRDELLRIEPAFTAFGDRIVGGTYTASDESGDARVFTEQLAERCAARGAQFHYGHAVESLVRDRGAARAVRGVSLRPGAARAIDARGQPLAAPPEPLTGDAVVVACGSYSAPLLRTVGIDLPIYPGKGYSATFALKRPDAAPHVSTIDDACKIAMSRLHGPDGQPELRVAGTIELAGFDLRLDTPLAQARCDMLARRVDEILPGVCDTRSAADGGDPHYWCGLRPATPTNIPIIGRTPINGLWVNAGHGTLGWTHGAGSGKALAALLDGEVPQIAMRFYGMDAQAS